MSLLPRLLLLVAAALLPALLTVSLWLPRAPAGAAVAREPTRAEQAAPGRRTALLPVDNEPELRTVVAAALAERGHAVAEAEGGATALALLDAGAEVAALVTDLAMPGGMDGLALLRQAGGDALACRRCW